MGTSPNPSPKLGLSFLALTAVAVGSMVGAGIFTLPRSFGASTGPLGALIAWGITGVGMYALARVFQLLSDSRSDLDAGIYAYAKEGFGNYMGFLAVFGYWFVACIGNVAYWVLITATMGAFFPIFAGGSTPCALILSGIGIWSFHFMILMGVKSAASTNTLVTIAKLIPILIFLLLVALSFDGAVFAENFWGGAGMEEVSIFQQVRATMLITVFVFIGVEGASVYSRYAQRRSDVGKATIAAFLLVLLLMVLVTLLPYGVLPRGAVASLPQPSMSAMMAVVVGHWGAVLICFGLLISVLGAYLAWSLLSIEVLYIAAKNGDMPSPLSQVNRHGVPSGSLWFSTLTIQILLFISLATEDAIQFLIQLSGSMILVPYFLVAAFAVQSAAREQDINRRHLAIASIATLYTIGMVYAGGLTTLLVSLLFYAPGTILYIMIRREQRVRVFTPREFWLFSVVVIGGVVGLIGFLSGDIRF